MRINLPGLFALALLLPPNAVEAQQRVYPMKPSDLCGSSQTCAAVIDRWNNASWADLVDDDVLLNGSRDLATVRWYTGEHVYTLQSSSGCPGSPEASQHRFCGVTDEFSNVMLNHAMGSDQARYQKLHRFSELLRHPSINNLQCWKFKIDGRQNYTSYAQVCAETDSASDASLRILGAYGIACAKQRAGAWPANGIDLCGDYVKQGNAIFGIGTASHGEVKTLPNGEMYLANGYNNQVGAPVANESFRPDYYELQFLMDFAVYTNDAARIEGVKTMLTHYRRAVGTSINHIHRGKTGHFDASGVTYGCDNTCAPAYMDKIDTWRAIPALSGLLNVHPGQVALAHKADLFDYWWANFAGGNPLYGPTQVQPMMIYSDLTPAVAPDPENSYKSLSMWIPLAAARNEIPYLTNAISQLVNVKYNGASEQFYGAEYYGGYFSQFAQRAIGSATGMIDPAFWAPPNLIKNGNFSGGTANWSLSFGNGASATMSVAGAAQELRIALTAGGASPWNVVAGQNGVALVQNKTYQLTFQARAAAPRTLNLRVVKSSGDWREYLNQTGSLGTTGQTYTYTFTVNDTVSPVTNLEFRAGGQGANDVWLDNVRLVRTN